MYVLEPTVTLVPLQIVCVFEEEIAAFSVIVADIVSLQPQVSVTITVYVPADNEEISSLVEPLSQEYV